ncbi:MAG: enoyl-CoA hydratase/isomerase family protein [Desulfurococcales archaeon]|nr:enoyl-CoA hydratase/isomerase family protein [Desulfurococcales archaeon]
MAAGVRGERSRGVYWIVLSRPEKLNSLDTQTLEEARRILQEACGDPEVRVVAITGEGRLFSAGIDLGEVASAAGPAEASRPFRALGDLIGAMLDCAKPVVAVLNGPAVAGGAELAAAADLAYAVEGAWLQWPEVKWGLIPPVAASLPLPPPLKARLVVAAEKLDAPEALRHGLLSGVYPSMEEARGAVEALAGLIEEAGWEAVEAALEAVRRPKRAAVELASRLVGLASSERLIEKARAFIASRR